MFYIELKLKSNNKNIYEIRLFLQYKIEFEPPREIANVKFLSALITDIAIREVFASVKQDASSA